MTCISTIDYQTRLDVHELLGRYSHYLDHDRGDCWADLFTTDGVFECADGKRLEGPAALATVPSLVQAKGSGGWRHLITGVVIDRASGRKDLVVRAYGPVLDMENGGAIAAFYDYEFALHFGARWRIRHVMATRVGAMSSNAVGVAALTETAAITPSLQ